jgi:transposase-like protein
VSAGNLIREHPIQEPPQAGRSARAERWLFPVEFRLRIVKLYLEEEYSPKLLLEQFGISTHSIQRWVRAYRIHGAAELELKRPFSRKSRIRAGTLLNYQ